MSEFNVSEDVKAQLLNERINALNLEGYQHELNLKSFELAGKLESPEADATRESINIIKNAIEIHEEELTNVVLPSSN
jgi:hypothetical protein